MTPPNRSASTTAAEPVATLAEAPSGARLNLDQLPRREPPEVEYLDGTVMVLPDGTRVALRNQDVGPEFANEAPGRSYFGFARFRSGWLTSTDSMGAILQLHDVDGLGDGVLIEPDGAISRLHGPGRVDVHGLSPGGSYLVATQRLPRPRTLLVARVDSGDLVVSAPGISLEQGPYWENERHFLVVAAGYILRIGIDGTIELAAGPATYGFVLPGTTV